MTKTLSDALARETELAAALFDTTRGVVVVMDPEGSIAAGNRYLAELGGVADVRELVGTDWFERFLPQEDRHALRELYHRSLEGEPVIAKRHPMIDHVGQLHQMEWNARPLFDDEGHVVGMLAVGIDEARNTAVQRAVAREQARFSSVIASTQDAFVLIDRHARIIVFNPSAQRIFGYGPHEVLGQKVDVLMPEPYRSQHDGYIAQYERTGSAKAIGRIRVVQGQRKGGEVFPIELSVTKVGVDEEARYAAFMRDISETVRLRQRAAERQRLAAIGTTSAKFAHEVGNPLNGMLMNLQLIQRRIVKGVPSAELAPLVQRVDHEVRRLSQLLDEFRSMSRRQSFILRPVEPHSLLQDFVQDHEAEFGERGVRVETRFGESLPAVPMDRQKMTQVLLNLAKNAVEAMEGGGVLGLGVHEDGEQLIIEVSDTGAGIPEGIDVFEPFATTKRDGTGLGLPVARQIVAAHGGELEFESTPGEGTTFRLSLPLETPAELSSVNLPIVRS